jgi:murein DD-endopeptidase MepM/ murein hydrolase activator NlpD
LGTDFPGNAGDEVRAIAPGLVMRISEEGWGEGNLAVVIYHDDVGVGSFTAVYGNLAGDHASTPAAGERVAAGQVIGVLASSEVGSSLHLGIHPGTGEITTESGFGTGQANCDFWTDGNGDGLPDRTNGFVDPLVFMTESSIPFVVSAPLDQTVPGNGAGNPANGSGCTPPFPPAPLPDGVWFGYVVDSTHRAGGDGSLVFDLGCFYTGEAALEEASLDGVPLAPGRPYVRNQNPATYTPEFGVGSDVFWVDRNGDHHRLPITAWPYSGAARFCPGDDCGVWLVVSGGLVIEIWEQVPDEVVFRG